MGVCVCVCSNCIQLRKNSTFNATTLFGCKGVCVRGICFAQFPLVDKLFAFIFCILFFWIYLFVAADVVGLHFANGRRIHEVLGCRAAMGADNC